MKKFIAVLLAVSMLLCSSVAFAAAPETGEIQQSNYFQSYGMIVTAIGGGKLKLSFSCTAVGIADQLGVATYCVQKKNSSGNWEDCTSLLTGTIKSNVGTFSMTKTFYGVAGETYRVKCTFVCSKNGGIETKAYTSGSKTAT